MVSLEGELLSILRDGHRTEGHAGVVDQDVQLSLAFHQLGGEPPDGGEAGQVQVTTLHLMIRITTVPTRTLAYTRIVA